MPNTGHAQGFPQHRVQQRRSCWGFPGVQVCGRAALLTNVVLLCMVLTLSSHAEGGTMHRIPAPRLVEEALGIGDSRHDGVGEAVQVPEEGDAGVRAGGRAWRLRCKAGPVMPCMAGAGQRLCTPAPRKRDDSLVRMSRSVLSTPTCRQRVNPKGNGAQLMKTSARTSPARQSAERAAPSVVTFCCALCVNL